MHPFPSAPAFLASFEIILKETATNIAQRQGHIVVIQAGNNTQNQGQGLDGNSREEEERQLLIIQPANTTQNQEEDIIIAQQQGHKLDESTRNSQKQGVINYDDFEPLPEGFVPEERANFSRPPGKRSAPKPKTG